MYQVYGLIDAYSLAWVLRRISGGIWYRTVNTKLLIKYGKSAPAVRLRKPTISLSETWIGVFQKAWMETVSAGSWTNISGKGGRFC
jgi:hypothetical protein